MSGGGPSRIWSPRTGCGATGCGADGCASSPWWRSATDPRTRPQRVEPDLGAEGAPAAAATGFSRRTTPHLRLVAGELQMSDVRQQVVLGAARAPRPVVAWSNRAGTTAGQDPRRLSHTSRVLSPSAGASVVPGGVMNAWGDEDPPLVESEPPSP